MAVFSENPESDERSVLFIAVLSSLVLLTPTATLAEAGTVSWGWALVGALSFGLPIGLGPRTRVGRTIDSGFRAIGLVGRTLVILLAVGVVWMGMGAFRPSSVVVSSFVVGGMLATLAVELAKRR